jgi:hypothetical protein
MSDATKIENRRLPAPRTAHTVRLNPEMYDVLSRMSVETGIPLSTLVDRGLTIGLKATAKLEVGDKAGWLEQAMTGKPVRLTVQAPSWSETVKGNSWTARVFGGAVSGVSGHPHITEEDINALGEGRNKGEI